MVGAIHESPAVGQTLNITPPRFFGWGVVLVGAYGCP